MNVLFSTIESNENSDTSKEKPMLSVVDKINDHFTIPICYDKAKVELKENISTDLELIVPIDPSGTPMYSFYFNNHNEVSKKVTTQIVKYYTTNVDYLQENQQFLKEYKPFATNKDPLKYQPILDIWNEIKLDEGFREKFYYVDWEILEFLNRSEIFLQFISVYNLFSPIFSLMMPILILILPFFIIRMRGLNLTISEYVDVLKIVAQTNAVGKLFTTDFSEITAQEKVYIFISAGFYLFSIYQNAMVCVRFNSNMQKIHGYFGHLRDYIKNTIFSMENFLKYTTSLDSHSEFNKVVMEKMDVLKHIQQKLSSISEYSIYNFSKFREIGNIFKYFYELHTDETYNDAILYSLGFNGYVDCLEGLQENLEAKKIAFATLQKRQREKDQREKDQREKEEKEGKGKKEKGQKKKNIFKNNYYACLKDAKPVKNTIKLKKNMIITGPNASGKTTILKSTLINIILSQQFGCGFYDSAMLEPFHHIHCYLNIPDTSGRDSLFQAEARRCKEILDCISDHPNDSHFCVFDELYSGTNPEEAETSATSFMLYLQKYKYVSSLLTTHFINVCKNLDKTKTIQNYKMVTQMNPDKRLTYTYKITKGISLVKGGINVLTDLNYPREILDRTQQFL
jgi:energy-coupling factor transporter ATP-binding protein EcfA2